MTKSIILFSSGNGSNVEKICDYFEENSKVSISRIFTNNPKAGVIQRAKRFRIPVQVFNKKEFKEDHLLKQVVLLKPNLIILSGFLWKIGENWVNTFPKQIINIHPALLPRYGGKGMYGEYVHNAVMANNEKQTGITIHYVNKEYDKGGIIFQKKVSLSENDSALEIAKKVQELEHRYFSFVIAQILKEKSDEV
tara:strand:+ start:611 stop:1192 length:582 start_codon:yes stop_codon:yes gene_type:complete